MHTRCIRWLAGAVPIFWRTWLVAKVGQETLESSSALLRLVLAWGQKRQLAVHFPGL